jgi:CheY-like chemotaxis protein
MTGVSTARVLVASDNADDANGVVRQLSPEFAHVRAASNPATNVADFEAFQPDVLVLAFDTLEKAQAYELALYRTSRNGPQQVHRTVLLCDKDSVNTAFEFCRKGLFDDYVLYWPQAQDGRRLLMSAINVARRGVESKAAGPSHSQLLSHLKQVDAIHTLLEEELTEGEKRAAVIEQSVGQARDAVGIAIDDLSRLLIRPNGVATAHPAEREWLSGELDRLKKEPVSQAFNAAAAAIAPTGAWPRELKNKLLPYLTGLGALRESIRQTPIVLVVDDNEFDRKLIQKALDGEDYELQQAEDGRSALAVLRRRPPDLILMDVNLPDISGVELTQRLKTLPRVAGIPVLMLTSESRLNVLEQSMRAGAAGFIVKPFSKAALLTKLQRFLPNK